VTTDTPIILFLNLLDLKVIRPKKKSTDKVDLPDEAIEEQMSLCLKQ